MPQETNILRLLPLPQAARALKLDLQTLQNRVQSGQITAFVTPRGEVMVAVNEDGQPVALAPSEPSQPRRKEDTPEYQAVAHLRGTPIWISEASRKYGIPTGTLTRWAQRGLIRRLGKEKNRVLVDEADVAYCVTVYRRRGGKRGRRLFDENGLPYQPKWPPKTKPLPVSG